MIREEYKELKNILASGKTKGIVFKEVAQLLKPEFDYKNIKDDDVLSRDTNVLLTCLVCKKDVIKNVRNFMYKDQGCQFCNTISKSQRNFMHIFSLYTKLKIVHADNNYGHDYVIRRNNKEKPFKVDGYNRSLNLIIEFDGCIHHGVCFKCGFTSKKAIINQNRNDLRYNELISLKYNIIKIKSCQWREYIKLNKFRSGWNVDEFVNHYTNNFNLLSDPNVLKYCQIVHIEDDIFKDWIEKKYTYN